MRPQAILLPVIKSGQGPYLWLAVFLAFCCLALLWPALPPAPPPADKPVLPPLTYLAVSRDRGVVLVIPLAGHELRMFLDITQERPVSPYSLDEQENSGPEEFSAAAQRDSLEDNEDPGIENAEPGSENEWGDMPEG